MAVHFSTAELCGVVLLCLFFPSEKPIGTTKLGSGNAKFVIDQYAPPGGVKTRGAVVLLPGAGGAESANFPFSQQARLFAGAGLYVYLPHYLDVTKGRLGDPQLSYGRWAQAVLNTIQYIQSRSAVPDGAIVIIGYSLGASVALCVGAPN